MPRRLIIGILIVLIVGIVGGTVVLVVQRLRRDETTTPTTSPGTLNPADRGSQQIVDPTGDTDGDGLSNADESLWGTLPDNADTDGDGFKDGEEVTANHNPTIAAPGDTLPPNFQPGQNLQPLTEAPLQVDQYFEEGLDVTGGTQNLTEEFDRQVSDDKKTPESLIEFAQTKPIITKLPAVKAEAITIQTAPTALTNTSYFNTAGNLNAISNKILLSEALHDLTQNGDASRMKSLASQIRLYQDHLLQSKVPGPAITFHKLLLGYTELLAATFDGIALWDTDPVKAVVALRQLDAIDRQYYPLIVQELDRLQ